MTSPQHILDFWFQEIDKKLWFAKDQSFDELLRLRFLKTHAQAKVGELFTWRKSPEGRLAEIIVLDQFSRNLFRDTAEAFSCDTLALVLAQEAVAQGDDQKLKTPSQQSFLYMPFMHSESLVVHEEAVRLFSQPGLENNFDFEIRHKKIIECFGRYPHRNALLNRTSTIEEIEFLKQPGSSF